MKRIILYINLYLTIFKLSHNYLNKRLTNISKISYILNFNLLDIFLIKFGSFDNLIIINFYIFSILLILI